MKLDTQHIGIDSRTTDQLLERLGVYRETIRTALSATEYQGSLDSVRLSGDGDIVSRVQSMGAHFTGTRLVVVVGIGGSNLGTKAVYEALGLPVRMEFVDTVDPLTIERAWAIMSLYTADEVCVCITTKSGETAETLANAEIILARMVALWGAESTNRVVVTSDTESALYASAQQQGMHTLQHEQIGGRYSVFSSVGMFPLFVAGCDIDALREGAQDMIHQLDGNIDQEYAALSAVGIYGQYTQGRVIHNTFVFNPELESIGKWYRQLMGESIGKKYDINDNEVRAGITPTVAVGSTDLHSMAQLYLADPGVMSTTFVYMSREGIALPTSRMFQDVGSDLQGQTTSTIMDAIYGGTVQAYRTNGIPCMEISIDDINAREIGQLLQMKMIEMMYTAALMNLNPFDQPSVEDYKQITRELLKK